MQRPPSRGSSIVPDSQGDSESDRDVEPTNQPPRPRSSKLAKERSERVKDFVHRQDGSFRQWKTRYRFTRHFTRGLQELREPLRLNSIQPRLGDFWIHEIYPEDGAQALSSNVEYQYWVFKKLESPVQPIYFWKEVWPGIGDWQETHPHPGCELIKLCWRRKKFKGKAGVLPTWVIQRGAPHSERSSGYAARCPLEIARPASPPPPLVYWEYVPESAENSDIEEVGTSKRYFWSNPGGCSPKTRLSPRVNTTQTPVAGPSMSPSATPVPRLVSSVSPPPSNHERWTHESLEILPPPSVDPPPLPRSRLPLSIHRFSAFNRQSRTPTVYSPSRSPSLTRDSSPEQPQAPTPQAAGILEWFMDILTRFFE